MAVDNYAPVLDPVPVPIKVKYASTAIIPSDLVSGKHLAQRYKLIGGEVVTLRWICTWNNESGVNDTELDAACREFYDMDFASVCAVWRRRIGNLSGYWSKVEMILSE